MSKTYPKSGNLSKSVSVTISSQESAYRTLLSVPFLKAQDRRTLMRAIVDGPELYWIRLAFNKGLMPEKSAARRESMERFLAGSGTENALMVLRGTQLARFRKKVLARLVSDPKSAYRVMKAQYVNLSQDESDALLDIILPSVTPAQAKYLLGRHIWDASKPLKTTPERRLKLVVALKGCDHCDYVAAQLISDQHFRQDRQIDPPFSPEERAILIDYAIQTSCWAQSLLYSLRDSWNARLTDEEKQRVAPYAYEYILQKLQCRYPDKSDIARAQDYLKCYAELLTPEQREQLTSTLQNAGKSKAA